MDNMGMYIVQIYMGDKRRKSMRKRNDLKDEASSTFEARQSVKKTDDEDERSPTSLLKKSELSAIFIVAGLITVIVFFFFFRSSDDGAENETVNQIEVADEVKEVEVAVAPVAVQSIEERIKTLEDLMKQKDLQAEANPSIDSYNARVERVEAALSMKFDIVANRLATLEKRIASLDTRRESSSRGQAKKAAPKKEQVAKTTPKASVAKAANAAPKAAKATKNGQVRYTVKKGDTLYSISKKHNTTVDQVRAMNKLSPTAEIFPGENLVVK